MRLRTQLWIGLTLSIALLMAMLVCILFMAQKGDAKPQVILPTPFYTNNHGQSIIILRRSKLGPWLKAHPNAKIISIGATRLSEYTIVYEEAKTVGE